MESIKCPRCHSEKIKLCGKASKIDDIMVKEHGKYPEPSVPIYECGNCKKTFSEQTFI